MGDKKHWRLWKDFLPPSLGTSLLWLSHQVQAEMQRPRGQRPGWAARSSSCVACLLSGVTGAKPSGWDRLVHRAWESSAKGFVVVLPLTSLVKDTQAFCILPFQMRPSLGKSEDTEREERRVIFKKYCPRWRGADRNSLVFYWKHEEGETEISIHPLRLWALMWMILALNLPTLAGYH